MKWLRRRIRKWLGIDDLEAELQEYRAFCGSQFNRLDRLTSDLVSIGVDVHFKEPHMILIYSKINGGQLRHIDVDFKNLKELEGCVRHLRERYRTEAVAWDLPPGMHFRKRF